MIVYVSPAEINGGILQFSVSITRETAALTACRLFLPDAVDKNLYRDIAGETVCYPKVKTLRGNCREIRQIAGEIMALSPDVVIFVEDSVLMQQLNAILTRNKVKTAMVVHDVLHHPYRKMRTRAVLVDMLRRQMTKKTVKHCGRMILLSHNSETQFREKYGVRNTVVFRLPAHVPETPPQTLPELTGIEGNYFLFFGRIDKYKGIGRLCRAYSALPEELKGKTGLVVAGKGQLSEEETALVQSDPHICLIRRFIGDGEMIWLFQQASAVVMPYIEASQSGVLPIAYRFGKPVIVSDLPGLTENVSDGQTGCIFRTEEELTQILRRFATAADAVPGEGEIRRYYEEHFLWKNNLTELFAALNVETKRK